MTIPKKIQQDDIVKVALEITRFGSLDDLSARRLALELNCSVQPIFYNFATMDELKVATIEAIRRLYVEYMEQGAQHPHPYKGMGLAYIRFARDFPNYFKILFMGKTDLTPETFLDCDSAQTHILRRSMEFSGLDADAVKDFHFKVWIFTHGLASLVATSTIQISDAEIERLLETTVREILLGHRIERGLPLDSSGSDLDRKRSDQHDFSANSHRGGQNA